MNGRRVYDLQPHEYEPGDYGIFENNWFCRAPGDGDENHHFTGNLSNHDVVEHENGSITVNPSILITVRRADKEYQWHGYLEAGIWREC